MIPKNKIIDDYEIKLPNKIRDDSLIKFCKENNCNDKIDIVHTDEKGKKTLTKHCIDYIKVKRSYRGELQCWQIHYSEVKQ